MGTCMRALSMKKFFHKFFAAAGVYLSKSMPLCMGKCCFPVYTSSAVRAVLGPCRAICLLAACLPALLMFHVKPYRFK